MTPNLIELIVQAVIKLNLDCFWSGDKTWIEDYRKELTTALASIPEMPQVDEPKATEQNVREFLQGYFHSYHNPSSRDKMADGIIKFLKEFNLLRTLPSPTTKTE